MYLFWCLLTRELVLMWDYLMCSVTVLYIAYHIVLPFFTGLKHGYLTDVKLCLRSISWQWHLTVCITWHILYKHKAYLWQYSVRLYRFLCSGTYYCVQNFVVVFPFKGCFHSRVSRLVVAVFIPRQQRWRGI